MDIAKLRELYLNRVRRDGYERELIQVFGIKQGFNIESIASEKKMRFADIALLITRDEREAQEIESGYRLYEYVQPR